MINKGPVLFNFKGVYHCPHCGARMMKDEKDKKSKIVTVEYECGTKLIWGTSIESKWDFNCFHKEKK